MCIPFVVAGSALTLVLVLALVREIRLRRALQRLLAQLLAFWRNRHDAKKPNAEFPGALDRDPVDSHPATQQDDALHATNYALLVATLAYPHQTFYV